ncbi:hypothetical protein N7E81_14820 [Reichenbachiella carrageenanivorans]|uniref:Outer membrane protein beta-barrel domain-containing protein n=1 Tax=Reichenbachiella carrageenanivorans TaxID=2979869 RepID=A0ABY6CXK1_9BACT|nr:hypothetical protein [Reichenbachiella carrageenanivorans]UXX78632.1 hypothetical protein N7E81_14820 [Reichenbachiella carrageenanivorans]
MKYRILIYLVLCSGVSLAQEYPIDPDEIYRSPVRAVLNQFSITFSTGYNATTYSHDLSGYYYLQTDTEQFITPDTGQPLGASFPAYRNWLNDPTLADTIIVNDIYDVPYSPLANPVGNPELNQGLSTYNADSLNLGFKGKGWGIPINLGIRYNYQNFRIGLGMSLEFHTIKSLSPTVSDMGIRNYEPNFKKAVYFSYFLNLGYKFYDFWDYSFAAELELGKNKMGKNFNSSLMSQGMLVNFGISIEKNLSEYFRVIVKPSYDFKNYSINIPEGGGSIQHKNPAFKVNVGISITIPEIPRSPMKSDHVQLKHLYTDPQTGRVSEVRGQPIWKHQNPKVGQNHRKLWRYKFKNRKKMNPY